MITTNAVKSDYEGNSIGSLCDGIEAQLWMAETHYNLGASRLGQECLLNAWNEYSQFRDILAVYAGNGLSDLLRSAMLQHGVRPGLRRVGANRRMESSLQVAA